MIISSPAVSSSTSSAAQTKALSELRTTVDHVVGSVFFEPLLRSMRNSVLKSTIGHGGRGEEIFQGQLDQVFAEQAGRSAAGSLNETLVARFSRAAIAHATARKSNDDAR